MPCNDLHRAREAPLGGLIDLPHGGGRKAYVARNARDAPVVLSKHQVAERCLFPVVLQRMLRAERVAGGFLEALVDHCVGREPQHSYTVAFGIGSFLTGK